MQAQAEIRTTPTRQITTLPDWKWDSSLGIGFLPLEGRQVPYDQNYFDNYRKLANTSQGHVINTLRKELVERHHPSLSTWRSETGFENNGRILDVGIGCGEFLLAMRNAGWHAQGIDVNPVALEWMEKKKLKWNGVNRMPILTFWDVLEHIPDPDEILEIHRPLLICLSMPIYRGELHALTSKHFKPGEHCWYFTESGLRNFMHTRGYSTVEVNNLESSRGGREDIWSFAFKRI